MSKRGVTSIRRTGQAARGVPAVGSPKATADIGVVGALSIGIGGIIGGGFFATFGLAVVGARSSTYLSFLLGGILALLTAYSYVRLALRYTEPGGTVGFVRRAFGRSLSNVSTHETDLAFSGSS
jgi:amino acid transporter